MFMLYSSDIRYLIQQINEKEPLTRKHNAKLEKLIESKYVALILILIIMLYIHV